MIQGFTESTILTDICTEDNRINTSVPSTQIRYLVKFINDLDGSVSYCYPLLGQVPRYTSFIFIYNLTPNMYNFQVNLLPAGHWKYEVYEVSWLTTEFNIELGTAPATETDVLPVANSNGVVQGIVTKGILNLTEKAGTEQVQYTQHETTEGTNTIYYGQ